MKKIALNILKALPGLFILYIILLIPDSEQLALMSANSHPFEWNSDQTWEALEGQFVASKKLSASLLAGKTDSLKERLESTFQLLQAKDFDAGDTLLTDLLGNFFEAASLSAAMQQSDWLTDFCSRVRNLVKEQSRKWDINSRQSRNTLYRILYGMRAATEEVLLQRYKGDFSPLMYVKEEPSLTPATDILGIKVHSGDLLVSRGGAEVSALISRGNDYPGNFSHVAIIYIDDSTGTPYLIESHIEIGVAIASVDRYLRDKKLRFMVLRPRADLPQLLEDPLLPQKAARYIYDEAQSRHIPYDFKMNFYDPATMFCSEVASFAYGHYDLHLWQGLSTISSSGVVNWLNTFGVENFITQMPSDLEYDPQLVVVAEWRDTETLLKDHIDNAVIDAMLEIANQGYEIDYPLWQLPFVRVLKFYNMLQNLLGYHGLIPEGMSAARALKNNTFVAAHMAIKAVTQQAARQFIEQNNYRPPYWKLFRLAQSARDEYYKK